MARCYKRSAPRPTKAVGREAFLHNSASHLESFLASVDTKPETKSSHAPTPATPANGDKKQLMTSHSVASGKTETTLLQPSTPPIHETNLVNSHDSTKNNVGPAGDWKAFGFPIQISRIQRNIHKEVNCLYVKMKIAYHPTQLCQYCCYFTLMLHTENKRSIDVGNFPQLTVRFRYFDHLFWSGISEHPGKYSFTKFSYCTHFWWLQQ